jgi:hypothetical protein
MSDESTEQDIAGLAATAERLDGLAETAELMGDPDAAGRLRDAASTARLHAMTLLDDATPPFAEGGPE